jgi:acetyltransferase-like isoleucine patch superfamily enzyme
MFLDAADVSVGRGTVGWRSVRWGGVNTVGSGCWFAGEVEVGWASRIGVSCIVDGPLLVGNYVSIGPHVSLGAGAHPLQTAAMYNSPPLFGGRRRALNPAAGTTIIGHDVWIGAGARVMQGVTVANGAIVGAGSVVTRDVGAYDIVAGAPARRLRSRFDPRIAELLDELAWWDRRPSELEAYEGILSLDLTGDVSEAIDQLKRFLKDRRA